MRATKIPGTNLFHEQHHGSTRWVVYLGRRFTRGLPRKRRFSDYKKASEWLLSEVKRREQQGASGFLLTPSQQEQAARAFALLAGRATMTEAVENYVRRAFPREGTKTTSQVVTAWLAAKKIQGRSKAYLEKIEDTFNALSAALPGNVNEITAAQLKRLIDSRKRKDGSPLSSASWNHYKADYLALFNWARKQGWTASNPAEELEERTAVKPAIGILTPSQVLIVLQAALRAPGSPFLGFFVLAFYAGLRTAELERITWERVVLDDGEPRVIVQAADAKDGEARTIDLAENAVAWLMQIPFRTGAILPNRGMGADRDHIASLRNLIGSWPRNAGRHSYVSYRSRISGEFRAAEDAGHESIRITRKRYKSLVSRRAAEAYFSIFPSTTQVALNELLQPPTHKAEASAPISQC